MPKSRARVLGRPIPLLIVATAVLIGTFSGVGYAASSRSAPTAAKAQRPPDRAGLGKVIDTRRSCGFKLMFHALTLLNGAKSAQGYGTGAPQYAVSAEGVVYSRARSWALRTSRFRIRDAERSPSGLLRLFLGSTRRRVPNVRGTAHLRERPRRWFKDRARATSTRSRG